MIIQTNVSEKIQKIIKNDNKKGKLKRHPFHSTCLSNLFKEGRVKLKKDNERSKRVKELQHRSQDYMCYQELHPHVKSNSLKNEKYEEIQEELEVIPAWRLNLDSLFSFHIWKKINLKCQKLD